VGGGWVDESLRQKRCQAAFDAQSAGLCAQGLVQVVPSWKLLVGLCCDDFEGRYQTFQTPAATTAAPNPPPLGSETTSRVRGDGLWSKRFGLPYRPSDVASYHLSYGISFNTSGGTSGDISGDTNPYDLPGSNTDPALPLNRAAPGSRVNLAANPWPSAAARPDPSP